MQLEIQRQLQIRNNIKTVLENTGVAYKAHSVYPNLIHFCYSQIESPASNRIVQESRGLILDAGANWKAVAYPFLRFGNYGESWATPIDWTTARAMEKVDGSLMVLWHYDGAWHVSTKGNPEASGMVGDYGFSYRDYFWQLWKEGGYDTGRLNPDYTYMLELVSPYNRVVCTYEAGLVLLGARNRETGLEALPETMGTGIPVAKTYPLRTVEEIIEAANRLNPIENEGFVVVDGAFNRVKIKSPAYVAIHHARDGFGIKRIVELIRLGEQSEVLAYFPELRSVYDAVEERIDGMVRELEGIWEQTRGIESQKEFAMAVKGHVFSGVLFAMWFGKIENVRTGVLKMHTDNLISVLKLREIGSKMVLEGDTMV